MTREEIIQGLYRGDSRAIKEAIKALEKESILDKIRADIIARYPKNYAREAELGGCACEFSLNQILQIIDKYKADMESEE